MAGKYANQKLQIGAESTKGTAVPATTIWRGHGMLEDARAQVHIAEKIGIATPTARMVTQNLLGKLSMAATPATYQQLPYILEAGIVAETPTQDGTGTDYIYVYDLGKTTVNTTRCYTIEGGDDVQAEEMEYSTVEKFALSAKYGELVQMSADWFGRQISDCTFTAALSVPTVEEIVATKGKLYIDEPGGTMGATQVTAGSILEASLDITTGWVPRLTMDTGQLYFHEHVFDREAFEGKLAITWRHAANAHTEKGKWQAGTARQIRLLFEGSQFATPGTVYTYHTLQIDLVGVYSKFNALDNETGDSVIKAEFAIGYDETADITPLTITVVNELSALT